MEKVEPRGPSRGGRREEGSTPQKKKRQKPVPLAGLKRKQEKNKHTTKSFFVHTLLPNQEA